MQDGGCETRDGAVRISAYAVAETETGDCDDPGRHALAGVDPLGSERPGPRDDLLVPRHPLTSPIPRQTPRPSSQWPYPFDFIDKQFLLNYNFFQFEAVIEEGNEALVHHMEVFHCETGREVVVPDYDGPCTDSRRPEPTHVCKRVLAAWAYGAGPFTYPQVKPYCFFLLLLIISD